LLLADGMVAVVTGAGRGIGRETALLFAEEGAAAVVVADTDVQAAEETAALIEDRGPKATSMGVDVSSPDDVQRMVDATVERYGRIDAAYNNAAVHGPLKPLHECTPEELAAVVAVNLSGVFLCMKFQIEAMLAQRSGAIVNAASGAGLAGVRGMSLYSATKHAVIGLSRVAGLEYMNHGIRVNAICAGSTDTTFSQTASSSSSWLEQAFGDEWKPVVVGLRANPRQIAEAVVWLCSSRASYINAAAVPVDNGWSAS
jgi:NAD(P)-dependent dehydrogenase (short-subunit alcohol dehydrogenase family)